MNKSLKKKRKKKSWRHESSGLMIGTLSIISDIMGVFGREFFFLLKIYTYFLTSNRFNKIKNIFREKIKNA